MPEHLVHEPVTLLLLGCTAAALAARAGPLAPLTMETLAVGTAYAATILILRGRAAPALQKARLASAYFVSLWAYSAVARITPALGLPLRDAALLRLDQALLPATPAVLLTPLSATTPWLTEILSACYLSYQIYLHGALLDALRGPVLRARRLFPAVFTALSLGYVGYLLVPALGPGPAFPGRFAAPLAGGPLSALNDWVVRTGSSRYDVFPSLHVALTAVLLWHDAWHAPRRFRVMLPIAAGLLLSTMYLRYHYAADILAGLLLAALIGATLLRRPPAPGVDQ